MCFSTWNVMRGQSPDHLSDCVSIKVIVVRCRVICLVIEVPNQEVDVQVVELHVPSSPREFVPRSPSPTPSVPEYSENIIDTETSPMVNQTNSPEFQTTDGTREADNRLSMLNAVTRKPNNLLPAPLPSSNDGVFSNLAAKPERDVEKEEENPPPYETAAADSAPPYWETTIIAPGMNGDDILVEGLPVGNVFSFVWNMLVSMSFQFVGFLLTYLLHTSHAAKNGSRAGLGFTLVQYGFYLRGKAMQEENYSYYGEEDPNDKEMLARSAWLSYLLMFLGWFIVIRSFSDYIRVKRMEAAMRTAPEENV
ncbi:hypothetical protein G9A89_019714 [Geosiphon pyriformis]|nr:hypothetical protein G9A89_019714 [Geosiphon pyriformis]